MALQRVFCPHPTFGISAGFAPFVSHCFPFLGSSAQYRRGMAQFSLVTRRVKKFLAHPPRIPAGQLEQHPTAP